MPQFPYVIRLEASICRDYDCVFSAQPSSHRRGSHWSSGRILGLWGGEEYQVGVRDYRSEPSFLRISFGVNGAHHLDMEVSSCPFLLGFHTLIWVPTAVRLFQKFGLQWVLVHY